MILFTAPSDCSIIHKANKNHSAQSPTHGFIRQFQAGEKINKLIPTIYFYKSEFFFYLPSQCLRVRTTKQINLLDRKRYNLNAAKFQELLELETTQ